MNDALIADPGWGCASIVTTNHSKDRQSDPVADFSHDVATDLVKQQRVFETKMSYRGKTLIL